MPPGLSFKRAKRENKEECQGEEKPCQKKHGDLLKKKFSILNLFSGYSKSRVAQGKNLFSEDKKRGLRRKESKKVKAPREEANSFRKVHSGKMCPKCEIVVCGVCNMLHTESSFIAHSLLDHYDKGRHSSCCSSSGFPLSCHKCKYSSGPPARPCPLSCNSTTK
nr:PREDICTED: uncharacterized protein LOC100567452 [Anolis carolinensis]|eukprot:XP_003218353.1 PREDICTED: uncharacterized protein LOC100567452 [Anolis carolinensis]